MIVRAVFTPVFGCSRLGGCGLLLLLFLLFHPPASHFLLRAQGFDLTFAHGRLLLLGRGFRLRGFFRADYPVAPRAKHPAVCFLFRMCGLRGGVLRRLGRLRFCRRIFRGFGLCAEGLQDVLLQFAFFQITIAGDLHLGCNFLQLREFHFFNFFCGPHTFSNGKYNICTRSAHAQTAIRDCFGVSLASKVNDKKVDLH